MQAENARGSWINTYYLVHTHPHPYWDMHYPPNMTDADETVEQIVIIGKIVKTINNIDIK